MVKLVDPRVDALREARKGLPSAAEIAVGRAASPVQAAPPSIPMLTIRNRMEKDLRVFHTVVLRYLLNRDPTELTLDICWWMDNAPQKRHGTMAFRGASKSWIAGSKGLQAVFRNPDENVMIMSGGAKRAVATGQWCLNLIHGMPELAHLIPSPLQRSAAQGFDVGPAKPSQSPSFNCMGIGGQVVGFRGGLIVPDDVETQTNSLTVLQRDKILEAVKEFDSLLKPGGEVCWLGTPHDSDSLYNHLPEVIFRVWPAKYPSPEQRKAYLIHHEGKERQDRLAPYIAAKLAKDPRLLGHTTEPSRFPDQDLEDRRASMGNSEFTLQFMLDTSLSDEAKYPLKLADLIVLSLDFAKGPDEIVWGSANRINDLPLLGLRGDAYYSPARVGDTYLKYQTITGFIDPSGRGQDETAFTIVGYLHGYIFLLYQGAYDGGATPDNLKSIAATLVRYGVQEVDVEDNFGDGMFAQLLRPNVFLAWEEAQREAKKDLKTYNPKATWGTSVNDLKSSNQMNKEKRILAILEPITQQHRLVVNREVIEADMRSLDRKDGEEGKRNFSLFYQYTHLTKLKDSLGHDDRVESLAGACQRYAPMLGVNPAWLASTARSERLESDLDKVLAGHLMIGQRGEPEDARGNRARAARPAVR